ncbi:MAG: GPW/gp25 family protein [Lewinella sp.]|uniref:GPW/gp25 family protein n=1 Tax=Lewinella sp. TaxID=2004506 RepID=UPI003D6BE8D5
MNNGIDKIIGIGWAFPPVFDPMANSARMVTGEEDIYQSLQVLFGTQIGERVLELDYGTDLSSLLFERLPITEKAIMENAIKNAVTFYEARIILHEITIDDNDITDGIVRISLDFTIDHTNNRRNMVFPFFVQEGTLIPNF